MNKITLRDILPVCNPDWIVVGRDVINTSECNIHEEVVNMEVKEITGFDDGLTVELFAGSSPCTHLPVGKGRK